MTQPIDVAYVDIIARVKEFRKDIKDLIDNEIDELDDALNDVLDEVDEHFKKTAREAEKSMADIDRATRRTARGIDDSLTESVDRAGRTLRDRLSSFGSNSLGFLERGLRGVGDAIGSAFSALPQAVSSLFSFSTIIAILVVALPGLVGLLIALGSALSELVGLTGLLPGGFAVLAAAIAPLVIGFQNFGDAISAILSKDPEKINEAMLKLAPAARAVAREFQAVLPLFTALQRTVQQSLFAPLIGDLTRLTKALILPLTGGLSRVADVLGQIISGIIDTIASPAGISAINHVFLATENILRTLGPALISVFAAFLPLVKASLPFIEKLSGKFAEALVKFAEFIQKSVDDGSFDRFVSGGLVIFGQLFDLIKSIGDVLGALFTSENTQAGSEFIDMLTQFFTNLAAFFRSDEGKQFLADLTTLAELTGKAILGLIVFLGVLFQLLTTGVVMLLDFFGVVDRTVVATKDTVSNMATSIVDTIASIPGKLTALGTFFADAGKSLIESFIGGFRKAGSFISDVAGDIVAGIKGGLNRFISTINAGIGAIDAALPFAIGRIPSLAEGGIAHARPGGILANIAEGGEDEVISPLSKLKDMIADTAGPSIVFEPGAINVNFAGALPTESDALTVGRAVGEGILATLQRRGVQLTMRAA